MTLPDSSMEYDVYKVLIADDELLVRIGLKTSIDWESNGFIVVGEARNGKEAIDLFEKQHPDIFITDVSMPNMNGLELIQVLKHKQENLKSIILTHYDNFNYAQQAINLGVVGYLLKSNLTEENLLNYLNKAASQISPSAPDTNPSVNLPDIEDFLHQETLTAEKIQKLKAEYFPYEDYVASVMKFHTQNSDPDFPAIRIANFEKVISNISSQVFNDAKFRVVPFISRHKALFILNINNYSSREDTYRIMEKMMILLKNNIKKYLNLNMSIGISTQKHGIASISQLVQEANAACSFSFFEKNNIAVYAEVGNKKNGPPVPFDIKELNRQLEKTSAAGIKKIIDQYFDQQKESRDTDYLQRTFRDLIDNIREVSGNTISEKTDFLDTIRSDNDIIDRFHNITSLKHYLVDMYTESINSFAQEDDAAQNSYIIRKSMDYIKKHSADNISLLTVAEHAEVSRSYLSFLFKQELGINFSAYITEIRVEKAKELLLNSNKKIYEIAEQVGFDSPYYFSKVFKEKCGMTCKEFRNTYYRPGKNLLPDA